MYGRGTSFLSENFGDERHLVITASPCTVEACRAELAMSTGDALCGVD